MPSRNIDTRTPEGVYATKGNIDPPLTAEGGVRGTGRLGVLADTSTQYLLINDAATGASGVITDDTTGQTADTGNLAAGVYDVYIKVRHPSTAAANRSVIVAHRNAADNADVRILKTVLADGPTGETRAFVVRQVTIAVGESVVARTGTDATNANIFCELAVTKVD